ncbi:MAG: hypothetical protein M5R42_00055 [Rhodocyclaceae bacterium]|nr:hypothetical protein [Rhodocyclaceae bacterium]
MQDAAARLQAFQAAHLESERSKTRAHPVACSTAATRASRHFSPPALFSCSTTVSP